MSGKDGQSISPSAISGTQDFINSHTQQHDPLQSVLSAGPGNPMTPSQIVGMNNPAHGSPPVAAPPNPIAQGAQQGAMAGLTAGLGAGDAAAAAARASGAMLPGSGSADALGGTMQSIGDHNRAAIQAKIDTAMKLMGGG